MIAVEIGAAPRPLSEAKRVPALDWMRGVVMLLMGIDHASAAFNAGRLFTDGMTLYEPGSPLGTGQFLTRWITHLCAPTFVLLAGAALALSVSKRLSAGESPRTIDRFIVTRGLFIAALDPIWMSPVMVPGKVLFQVLYAIGGSLCAMALLRRLSDRALLIGAGGLIAGGEVLVGGALYVSGPDPALPAALLLTGGRFGRLIIAYPVVPWLAIMMLGFVLGRRLRGADPAKVGRFSLRAGVASLALFALVRGMNAYGNMRLLREDMSLVQWLHVSKYPPSLSFVVLELGIAALCLSALFRIDASSPFATRWARPLTTLGQTSFFFYLLHVHLLTLVAWALGRAHEGGLLDTYVAAAGVALVLLPLCTWYRGYKRAHPNGWTRYI